MNIALIGYGLENASAYNYLSARYPEAAFTVYDQAASPRDPLPEGVAYVGALEEFTHIEADIFVRSPGISPYKIVTDKPVTSATKLFFDGCTVPIIGVTGSKGKGTTSSLAASILTAAGYRVHLVGNIGTPALDALPAIAEGDIVVYELSSFQLWDLQKSPQTGVVLMIEPEHLDVHRDLADYVNAKANIARYQTATDRLIYRAGNDYSASIAALSAGTQIPFQDDASAHFAGQAFYYGETWLAPETALKLPGEHNRDNACAAIDAVWPWVQDPDTIARGLSAFEGLPHRLKFVTERGGVQYFDDSIATTPGSAIAAIHAFYQPKVLILGGSSKGANFNELAHEIAHSNVTRVILIGDEADRIKVALDGAHFEAYDVLGTAPMTEIVSHARDAARPGDVVVLSPACASFGMFKNYADRGEQFVSAANQL